MKKCLLLFCLAICYRGFSQKIIVTTNTGDFYSIDILNCKDSLLVKSGFVFNDISYTTDGRLWGISAGQLYQIDTLSYKTNYIGDTGLSTSVTLVEVDDSTLIIDNTPNLYRLNVNTLSKTSIGGFGSQYYPAGDLAWYNNDLYMTCSRASGLKTIFVILRIAMNANYTTITRIEELKGVPIFFGLVTIPLSNETPIIGFDNGDIYKICHEDGSCKKVCSLNLPAGSESIFGAASMKLPVPIIETGPCSYSEKEMLFNIPNVFTPNNDGINDVWKLTSFPSSAIVQIFNRWGIKVNEGMEIKKGEIYSWDGDNCSDGIYYYTITTSDNTYSGFLNLLR